MESLRHLLERLLRIPPEPHAPLGDESALCVFRAAPGFLRMRVMFLLIRAMLWALLVYIPALVGLAAAAAALDEPWAALAVWGLLAALVVWWAIHTLLGYLRIRIDYDYRWYKVTDRSLRIREGVFFVREMTMTFANIQNVSVSQGPVERIFGIAHLRVDTAGGGAGQEQQGRRINMHTGYFRGIENAETIRAMMLERLRTQRGAGLGEESPEETEVELLAAIRDEARRLRAVAQSRG